MVIRGDTLSSAMSAGSAGSAESARGAAGMGSELKRKKEATFAKATAAKKGKSFESTKMKMTDSESNHVFSCAFGGGVTATAIVDVTAARSEREWIRVKWNGVDRLVPREHADLFRAWMLDVQQTVADLLNAPLTWGFGPDMDNLEVYQFVPGQPCHRVQ